MDGLEFKDFFTEASKESGNFQNHIEKSIPGYHELTYVTGQMVATIYKNGGSVLDLGSSEGYWGDHVANIARALVVFSLDPNTEMAFKWAAKTYRKELDNHLFIQKAWWKGFLDGTEWVQGYKPINSFNVIKESMTFQFISNDRESQYSQVKEALVKDGLFITNSKCYLENVAEYNWYENTKDWYKSQYFSPEQLAKKASTVLPDMGKHMATLDNTLIALKNNFEYVYQYWVSGNFHGFVASDSAETIIKWVAELPKFNDNIQGHKVTIDYIKNL